MQLRVEAVLGHGCSLRLVPRRRRARWRAGRTESRALAGRRGAGRPELDLLGYAPRSQRLAQLLGGVRGSLPLALRVPRLHCAWDA